jgi:hypothetical protein
MGKGSHEGLSQIIKISSRCFCHFTFVYFSLLSSEFFHRAIATFESDESDKSEER